MAKCGVAGRLGALVADAVAALRANDTGLFVKPAPAVYPFQWNWDSAFVALGLARVDPERGRQEVRSLLAGQWADGMVPHIVFHASDRTYAPGPELWGSTSCPGAPSVPTSGLTQPPLLATAIRALHEAAPDRSFLEDVVPRVEAWHRWLHGTRRLDGSGLVAILHPWESADDAPRFDAALARICPVDELGFVRTDRRHVDDAQRPRESEYRRYLAIVEALRACDYRPSSLAAAPFAFLDLCFNAVLAVAEADLALLLGELGASTSRAEETAARLRAALASCWDEDASTYRDRDLHGGACDPDTVSGLFPLYAGVPDGRQAERLVARRLWSPEHFGPSAAQPWALTTVSKASDRYDPVRFWRGPVWVNVNWFLVRGLERCGFAERADALRSLTLRLVERSGFAEYYHPATGAPLGSERFSWSAALALDLVS